MTTPVQTFHKYMKIHILGHDENKEVFADPEDDLIIQEKMDGGNFRFYINEHGEVICGSRGQVLDLTNKNTKNFRVCSEFVKKQVYENLDKVGHAGLIFYGECMISHTLQYDWEHIPRFLGFDILDVATGKFLPYDEVTVMYKAFGLPTVPFIRKCKAKDIGKIDDNAVPVSAYVAPSASDRQAEGIVIKNYNKQLFAKYVRDKFKEANATAFGGNPKYNRVDDTNNAEFIFKYVTNARIEKMILKLVDEGEKLDLPLMSQLPKRIIDDVWEEHWREIKGSNWKLDFSNLRQLIPKRCLAVLRQVIVNKALVPNGK